MFHVRVVHLSELVLLALGDEVSVPIVARFLLEDCSEFLLCFFNVVKGRLLVHAMLTNASISRQYDVKLAVRVKEHLHLVEDVVTIGTIPEVHLGRVCVPGLSCL